MAYTQWTKTQWRRNKGPLSTKLFDEFKLVKTEYDNKIHAGTGSTGYALDGGGPATCSSNILTVSFGVSFTAAPIVIMQSENTSSIITPETVTSASFIASSSEATTVFKWLAFGA
jgi:hypothetical protein